MQKVSVVCAVEIGVANAMLSGHRVSAAFTKNKIQHAPRRIVPNIAIDVEGRAVNIAHTNIILTFFFEIAEINRLEITDGCLLRIDFTLVHYTVRYIVDQLEAALVVLYAHYR